MADAALYTEDLFAGLISVGSGSVVGIAGTDSSGTATKLCDIDQCTLWAPNASGTFEARANIGTTNGAKNAYAVFFGNCEGISGKTITVIRSTLFGGAGTAVTFASFTAPSLSNFLVTGTPGANQFWLIRVASMTAASKIGTACLLSEAGRIAFTGNSVPRYPVGRPMAPAHNVLLSPASRVVQVVGGTQQVIDLTFDGPRIYAGGVWDTLEARYQETNGFESGVVWTDAAWSSPGRAYYGHILGGLRGGEARPDAAVQGGFTIELLPEGLVFS